MLCILKVINTDIFKSEFLRIHSIDLLDQFEFF